MHQKAVKISINIIIFMLILTFISPILYDIFCKNTGYAGAVKSNNYSGTTKSNIEFDYKKLNRISNIHTNQLNNLSDKNQYNENIQTITMNFINETNHATLSKNIEVVRPENEIKPQNIVKHQNMTRLQNTIQPQDAVKFHLNKENQDSKHKIKVEFDTNINPNLNWKFAPKVNSINIIPGQAFLVYFYIKNLSNQDSIGTAIYNVSPLQVGQYFIKIQCFCFENIFLRAFEEITVPVLFYIDEEMLNNLDTKNIKLITLSYTFFTSNLSR